MKISKLISEMERLKVEHGDIDVCFTPENDCSWYPRDIQRIAYAPNYDDTGENLIVLKAH